MTSHYNGCGTGDTSLHMIHYFDGQRVREVEVITLYGKVNWTEKTIQGILEVGMDYRTAKRRLATLEKRATQRIG